MKKLEEQLKSIQRPIVTEQDVLRNKRTIHQKRFERPKTNVPTIFVICIAVILCVLILPSVRPTINTAQPMPNTDYKEAYYIWNQNPKRIFDATSWNYVAQSYKVNELQVSELQQLMKETMANPLIWNGEIKQEGIYDLTILNEENEKIQYRIAFYDEHYEGDGIIYDVANNVQYELSSPEAAEKWQTIINQNNPRIPFKYVLWAMGILFVVVLAVDYVTRRNYSYLDDRGRRKQLPRYIGVIGYLVLFLPTIYMSSWHGVFHLGYLLFVLGVYNLCLSVLELKLQIMKPNVFYNKIFIPFAVLLLILGFMMIFVV